MNDRPVYNQGGYLTPEQELRRLVATVEEDVLTYQQHLARLAPQNGRASMNTGIQVPWPARPPWRARLRVAWRALRGRP